MLKTLLSYIGLAEKSVEDHIAPLAKIIKNLEALAVAKAKQEEQHLLEISKFNALRLAAASETERAKAIAAKISALFS